jgi:hypothetical protein
VEVAKVATIKDRTGNKQKQQQQLNEPSPPETMLLDDNVKSAVCWPAIKQAH